MARKIRKGDTVQVVAGDDKGKVGRVLSIDEDKQRVVVEKVNFVKRHTKARRGMTKTNDHARDARHAVPRHQGLRGPRGRRPWSE